MATLALTFLMTINPTGQCAGCATTISDNTFASDDGIVRVRRVSVAIIRARERARVPTVLCVCGAWDRHCLLLAGFTVDGSWSRADTSPIPNRAGSPAAASFIKIERITRSVTGRVRCRGGVSYLG